MIKKIIHNALKKRGKQIIEYPESSLQRKLKTINHNNINTILDIGANIGQYGLSMRELGYTKKLISFEPMKDAFGELEKNSKKDKTWVVKNYALGDQDGRTVINVSGNSFSSSILNMLPSHEESAPESKYVAQEEIEIKKLDTVFDSICGDEAKIMIKVDTQGFEKNVLDGASKSLNKIKIVELEMSLIPLYKGDVLYKEMIAYLENRGFELFSLEHVFSNPETGQLLQVDGMFVKK